MNRILGILGLLVSMQQSVAAPSTRILLIRKGSTNYEQVANQLRMQLPGRDWDEWVIDKSVTYEQFESRVQQGHPAMAVLMDNEAVDFTLRWNAKRPANERVKAVALMALNLKSILKGNTEVSGVAFESPVYSMMTQFRYLLDQPLHTVSVLYRKSAFGAEIGEATQQLKAEGIQLKAVNVDPEGGASIDDVLRDQLQKQVDNPSDVLWVQLDSALLNPRLFASVWRPAIAKLRTPVVVGAENLVGRDAAFGTFAVTPDLRDLVAQASQMIESIERGTPPLEIGVEDFTGVRKIFNLERAKALGLKVRQQNLNDVEVVQ